VLSHEHLDHIGTAWRFNERRTFVAAHRLAANKIMLRDHFPMLRKMFNGPNVPIKIDIWLEQGNLIDLGNFRLNVMYMPGHTSACITLFDVRSRHSDAWRRDGRCSVRAASPTTSLASRIEHKTAVARPRPPLRHAAGRCPHRDRAFARAAGGHQRNCSTR
jgi:hypothetical protein